MGSGCGAQPEITPWMASRLLRAAPPSLLVYSGRTAFLDHWHTNPYLEVPLGDLPDPASLPEDVEVP